MIKKMTSGCISLVQKYLPDPFIFALILSAIVFVCGILLNHTSPIDMIKFWGNGFWGFLAFSMQMVLVVVLGNCLASAPVFTKLLQRLADIPKTPKQAVAFCTVVAGIACMIQWGFGLVLGAIFAKELAKRVKGVDYRLLIAAAYSTFLLTVPTSSIILNASMHPSPEDTFSIDPKLIEADEKRQAAEAELEEVDKKNMTPAERLENSKLITYLVSIAGIAYLVWYFGTKGFSMNIDIMNFMLFIFGILLNRTPIAYVRQLGNAVRSAAGIILQFPFYAGIAGMMVSVNAATGTSLAGIVTSAIASVSTRNTFPIFTFLSGALVNMFVPSAGGQWGVQAPIMFPAGQALGVDPAMTTVALTWGDTWTNMIQPFWALPALGIAGLKVRDIMGFCVMVTLMSGIIIFIAMLIWPMIAG